MYEGDWAKQLCNGCYGRLLSLYEIKAGTASDDERAEGLALTLLAAVALDDQRRAEQLFQASDNRAEYLSTEALRFVATAEHVARQLDSAPQLEWSPAVIGLCKAVEAEVANRILHPLFARASAENLDADLSDKDLGRIATFCSVPSRKVPELGTFAHFLQTVIHSEQRRATSPLIRSFLQMAADWTGSQWLLEPTGLQASLSHKEKIDPKVAADQRGHDLGVAMNTYIDSDVESRLEAVTKLEAALEREEAEEAEAAASEAA